MVYPELESLLRKAIGLDASSIGPSAIERAVRERSSACNLHDEHAYLEHVSRSQPELQELIDAVVVPETWFFRDPEAFRALSRTALHDWLPSQQRFQIDAVDISARAIAQAELGVYGKNSFRSAQLTFRDRHFERRDAYYRIGGEVRAPVSFQRGNLLFGGWQPSANEYDAIFCRNLLIYFDRPTQLRAIAVLRQLLAEHALLLVGPSEAGLFLEHRFVSAGIPMAFAFRKSRPRAATTRPVRPARARSQAQPPLRAAKPAPPARPSPAPAAAPPPTPHAREPESRLDAAMRLADLGRIAEAGALCKQELDARGPSAQLHFLWGLVRSADGMRAEAVEHYRKALFLDRHHRDAMIHLALLLEQQGDPAGAELLRDRARRCERESQR
jgi:chemotaxis protein methyltransferase WspC